MHAEKYMCGGFAIGRMKFEPQLQGPFRISMEVTVSWIKTVWFWKINFRTQGNQCIWNSEDLTHLTEPNSILWSRWVFTTFYSGDYETIVTLCSSWGVKSTISWVYFLDLSSRTKVYYWQHWLINKFWLIWQNKNNLQKRLFWVVMLWINVRAKIQMSREWFAQKIPQCQVKTVVLGHYLIRFVKQPSRPTDATAKALSLRL